MFRQSKVGEVGFEPTISCSRSTRNPRLSYTPKIGGHVGDPNSVKIHRQSAQRESNPHVRHGKATGSHYIMGAINDSSCDEHEGAPGGSRTHIPALRRRCLGHWTTRAWFFFQMGSEGFEPSPRRLRAGDAAANTSIPLVNPCCMLVASRTAIGFVLLAMSEAGGIRTPTRRSKSPVCCRYTTTPKHMRVGAFQSLNMHGRHIVFSQWLIVRGGIEPATDDVSDRHACHCTTGPDDFLLFRSEWAGRRSNPRLLVFSQALYRLSYQPKACVFTLLIPVQRTNKKGRHFPKDAGPQFRTDFALSGSLGRTARQAILATLRRWRHGQISIIVKKSFHGAWLW